MVKNLDCCKTIFTIYSDFHKTLTKLQLYYLMLGTKMLTNLSIFHNQCISNLNDLNKLQLLEGTSHDTKNLCTKANGKHGAQLIFSNHEAMIR